MKIFGKDTTQELVIIAEIGVNHEGDLATARELLELAAKAGADAVKFQSFSPKKYVSSSDADRFKRVSKFAIDIEGFKILADDARKLDIGFFSTPLSEDWVEDITAYGDAIKIASGDITFEPVVRAAARSGKPVLISTGCSDLDEIDAAVSWVRDEVGDEILPDRLALLQCVSAYPTPVEEANVLSVPFLAERYGLTTGYSNHVIGPEACHAAIAHGANLIEVHFTNQKHDRDFHDHQLSFDPDDLAALVVSGPRIAASLGVFGKRVQSSEVAARGAIRKGLVAAVDLDAGIVLKTSDIGYARPATEFASSELDAVVGRTLNEKLAAGEVIKRADIA
jgi:N,N'-diacetyllegionaminate synthase